MSLGGFIAGPHGEADWIIVDPGIDFEGFYREFDTILMGRHTYEWMNAHGGHLEQFGMKTYVFSRTLRPEEHPDVTIVAGGPAQLVGSLRSESGRDIWLFGGGRLFQSLLGFGVVDTVEVAVIPILLGDGIPLLPAPAPTTRLRLTKQRVYEQTGIVGLEYTLRTGADPT